MATNQEQKCIELLIYHLDGLLTRDELIFNLSSLDESFINKSFPDYCDGQSLYTVKQETLKRKNVTK